MPSFRRPWPQGAALALVAALQGVPAPCAERTPGALLALPGAPRRTAALTVGGQSRPALVETASFEVAVPERALLTFGVGLSGQAEVAWTYRVRAREGRRTLADVPVLPDTRRWWDFTVLLTGPPRRAW